MTSIYVDLAVLGLLLWQVNATLNRSFILNFWRFGEVFNLLWSFAFLNYKFTLTLKTLFVSLPQMAMHIIGSCSLSAPSRIFLKIIPFFIFATLCGRGMRLLIGLLSKNLHLVSLIILFWPTHSKRSLCLFLLIAFEPIFFGVDL